VKPSQIADTFTHARAGGARVHDAIDIMAPAGTPVVAAAPGRLEKLFYSKGGGGVTAYVRSFDGKWSYYYAHLQDYAPGLKEGMTIRRGQMLGRVGFTGNANPAGTASALCGEPDEPGRKLLEGEPGQSVSVAMGK
jgi:murein DD-endopeptidase MepM/ murein hydrolase activator NlpD